jgi:hypothetical protein
MKPLKFVRSVQSAHYDGYTMVFLTDKMLEIEFNIDKDTGLCTVSPDAKIAPPLKESLATFWKDYYITTQEDLDSKFAEFKMDYASKV